MTDTTHSPTSPRRARRGLVQVPPAGRTNPPRTKAGTQDARVHNRSLVFATLYHHGPMSRSELARVTTLTAPTISALVAELEADGLVVDLGPREGSRVGKPANLFGIRDDGACIVVVDLSPTDRFSGAVVDLRGRFLARAELAIDEAHADAAITLVVELVERLMALAPRRVLGIGVGSPGIIDDGGRILHAAHLEWMYRPMAQLLSQRFSTPAYVGNDMNVAALGVLHFREIATQNLMVITIEHGVGAGLIVGGELVEGEQFAAGEIGHITVDERGDSCLCGRRGCLEVYIGAAQLARRVRAADPEQRPGVLAEAGWALGMVLAPIISTLNLNEIVLTGPPELIEGPMLETALRTTKARTLPEISASLQLRSLAGEGDLTLIGGASLVLAGELGVW